MGEVALTRRPTPPLHHSAKWRAAPSAQRQTRAPPVALPTPSARARARHAKATACGAAPKLAWSGEQEAEEGMRSGSCLPASRPHCAPGTPSPTVPPLLQQVGLCVERQEEAVCDGELGAAGGWQTRWLLISLCPCRQPWRALPCPTHPPTQLLPSRVCRPAAAPWPSTTLAARTVRPDQTSARRAAMAGASCPTAPAPCAIPRWTAMAGPARTAMGCAHEQRAHLPLRAGGPRGHGQLTRGAPRSPCP